MELGDSLGDGVGSAEIEGLEEGLSDGASEIDGDAYVIKRVQLRIFPFINLCQLHMANWK